MPTILRSTTRGSTGWAPAIARSRRALSSPAGSRSPKRRNPEIRSNVNRSRTTAARTRARRLSFSIPSSSCCRSWSNSSRGTTGRGPRLLHVAAVDRGVLRRWCCARVPLRHTSSRRRWSYARRACTSTAMAQPSPKGALTQGRPPQARPLDSRGISMLSHLRTRNSRMSWFTPRLMSDPGLSRRSARPRILTPASVPRDRERVRPNRELPRNDYFATTASLVVENLALRQQLAVFTPAPAPPCSSPYRPSLLGHAVADVVALEGLTVEVAVAV